MKAQGGGLPEASRGVVRLAFRIARRILLQWPGRSVLVIALIAVPILGVTGIDTIEASHTATTSENVRLQLGQTSAMISVVSAPDKTLKQDPLEPSGGTMSSGEVATSGQSLRDPAEVLPAGTRLLTTRYLSVVARTASGLGSFQAVEGQPWDRAFAGMYDVVDGHRPTSKTEVMVSPAGLAHFGVALGGTLHVTKPKPADFTVVGTLKNVGTRSDTVVVYANDGALDGITAPEALTATSFFVVDHPIDWQGVRRLNAQGMTVLSRSVLLDPPSERVAPRLSGIVAGNPLGVAFISLLGAFGMFEVCLLAGAAFAVGAKRRQRELAILSSVGAERRTLFAIMSFEGILLGFLGGIVGAGLGILAASIAEPLISDGLETQYPGFHVDWPVVALIVLGATVSGWIAAAIPARTASRVDVVAALRGALRPPQPTLKRPIVGFFVAVGGSVVALMGGLVVIASQQGAQTNQKVFTGGVVLLVAGPILMQIGALLIAPRLLVWATSVLSRWGTGARLGSRDAARNPSRTVPALAAIMSTVFVSAFAMCLVSGGQAISIREHQWNAPDDTASVELYGDSGQTDAFGGYVAERKSPGAVPAVLARAFPGSQVRVLSGLPDFDQLGDRQVQSYVVPRLPDEPNTQRPIYLDSGGLGDHVLVGSEADLRAILGESVSAESRATLEAGGIVSLYPQYVTDGRATLDTVPAKVDADGTRLAPTKSVEVRATVQRPEHDMSFGLFLLPKTATALGLHPKPSMVFATLAGAPTTAQREAADAQLAVADDTLSLQVETGPDLFAAAWSWALLGLTTLIAVVAAAVALALAKADARRDDEVLEAIGAPPGLQRSYGFWQAILIAGLGAVIGVGLGLVPAFALGLGSGVTTRGIVPFDPPWLQLGLTAVAMPLLIASAAWVAARWPSARGASGSRSSGPRSSAV